MQPQSAKDGRPLARVDAQMNSLVDRFVLAPTVFLRHSDMGADLRNYTNIASRCITTVASHRDLRLAGKTPVRHEIGFTAADRLRITAFS